MNTTVRSYNTELKDRVLWFDGDSTYYPNKIESFLTTHSNTAGIFVTELTKDIEQYNSLVSIDQKIKVKQSVNSFNTEWNIPDSYKTLDVKQYVFDVFEHHVVEHNWSDEDIKHRIVRINTELGMYKQLRVYGVLRTLIYIINTLTKQNVVWGVGRGSGVASYVLYLIGVHDVDSVAYDLDITEFLRIDHKQEK